MNIAVTQFKAKCLGIIEMVQREKSRITITQSGRPIAELIPIVSNHSVKLFGRSKQTTLITGDILSTEES